MARRKTPVDEPAEQTRLKKSRDETRIAIEQRIALGRDIIDGLNLGSYTPMSLENLRASRDKWSDYNEQLLGKLFTGEKIVGSYRSSGWGQMVVNPSLQTRVDNTIKDIKSSLNNLESIIDRLELFDETSQVSEMVAPTMRQPLGSRVFIVHGRNEALKHELARFIDKLGLEAVILSEQANEGRTIIEKIEASSDVAFAVVLLTGDDVGTLREYPDDAKPRARQNVILELGYFIGLLGRSRVCPIYESGVELPSDVLGVGYVAFDAAGAWRFLLIKELKAAGLNVDANNAL